MSIQIGINFDYVRSADKPFRTAVELAQKLGYAYVEPFLHTGREMMSEAGYYHSFSMEEDPLTMKDIFQAHGVTPSAVSAHCPLLRPEISVPYLDRAIRFAAAVGAPIVNTDEGALPSYLTEEEGWQTLRYTLKSVLRTAERYNIAIGIEPHQIFTKTTPGLLKVATLVESPMLRINYDTGNAYLCGEDPYEGLEACGALLAHVHAKDISVAQSDAERGQVTGTAVGCACGDGVFDWTRVLKVLRKIGYEGVLSVECGTIEQAARSLEHLNSILAAEQNSVDVTAAQSGASAR